MFSSPASEVVPGSDVQPCQALFRPAGTPADLARKISADLGRRVGLAGATRQASGVEPEASKLEEFAAHVKRELARWTEGRAQRGRIQPE